MAAERRDARSAGARRAARVMSRVGSVPMRHEWLLSIGSVAAFLVLWEVLVRAGLLSALFFSSPTAIAAQFVRMLRSGVLLHDLRVSAGEFLLGYGLSIVVGIPLGILMGWYRGLAAVLQPFVSGLYATPRVAIIPLIIIWFGIGLTEKVAFVFLLAVFQILLNAQAGVRSVDPALVKTARSFGASDWAVFTTLVLPASVPFLIAGLRLAIGSGLIGVAVAELYAATAGIGYEISVAGQTFQTATLFVGLSVLALSAIALMWLLQRVENRFQSWRAPNL